MCARFFVMSVIDVNSKLFRILKETLHMKILTYFIGRVNLFRILHKLDIFFYFNGANKDE